MSSQNYGPHTDEEWIRLLAERDPTVMADLWCKLVEWGVTSARKRNQPDDLGKDAAVQTFMRITKHIGRFAGSGLLYGWCRKITVNEVLRLIEKNQKSIQTVDDALDSLPHLGTTDPMPQLESDAVQERLRSCLNGLQKQERLVVESFYLQEKSPAIIADDLEIERNYVHQLAHQARKKLKRCLERLGFHSVEDVLSV